MGRIGIRRLDAPFGVEVDGLEFDALERLDAHDLEKITTALHGHRLLVFRGSPREDAALVAFAERFGRLVTLYDHETTVPGFPGIVRVSNIEEAGRPIGLAGSQEIPWHHDHGYLDRPARESFLEATVLPSAPPRTCFIDMAAALASLPTGLRARLHGLRAVHHIDERSGGDEGKGAGIDPDERPRHLTTGATPDYHDETNVLAQDRIASHHAIHPVVVRHPLSGVDALYVSPLATHEIVGLQADASKALLDELFDHALRDDFLYAHAWLPGDLVVWDTLTALHRRDAFDPSSRRLMKQMSTGCDAPLEAGA
jgi:alpha-ketoglutarate-dependent taurine dioxygenase